VDIKEIVRKLQSWEPEWFSKNSWVNESVGGALGVLVARLIMPLIFAAVSHIIKLPHSALMPASVLVFTLVSVAYELKADPWGWSLDDVGQREAGALFVAWLWCLFGLK
jgi:hypothetical protein